MGKINQFDGFRRISTIFENDPEMNELHIAISLSYDFACASLKVSHITKADRYQQAEYLVGRRRLTCLFVLV